MARTETGSRGKGLTALIVFLLWAIALAVSPPSFQTGGRAAASASLSPAAHSRTGLPPARTIDAVDHRGVAVRQQGSGDPDPLLPGTDIDPGSLPADAVPIVSGRHVAAAAPGSAAVRAAMLRTADARAPPFHS